MSEKKKKRILTSSCKAKGRNLQKYVVERILHWFPKLSVSDVIWTSMGASGEDIKLSEAARKVLPVSIECKSMKAFSVLRHYEQAKYNAKEYEPVLIIKENRGRPFAVVDLEYLLFLQLTAGLV